MIPLTFLYDEYIDRPKLTEQKKPFEYIVPPRSGVGTITLPCVCREKQDHCIFFHLASIDFPIGFSLQTVTAGKGRFGLVSTIKFMLVG